MKKLYGVALIGCGQMGQVHLEHIYYKDNIKIVSVCDLHREKAEEFQRKFGASRVETDWEACVQAKDIDIVIIATYPSTHLAILEKCLVNQKHVICEKPIATNMADGKRFIELCKQNPRSKVLVGHILRHNKTYQTVARMIREGAIGKPIVMRMVQNHHTMNWQRYLALINETSPVIDCGVHYFDVMQWFTGEKILDVSGITCRTEPDVPEGKYNYGLVTVKLSGGSVGYYEAGWSNTISANNTKEFAGPLGSIRITYQKDRTTHQEEGDLVEYYRYPEKKYEMINILSDRKPTDLQLDTLIGMIEDNTPANPSLEEVMESFQTAMLAHSKISKA